MLFLSDGGQTPDGVGQLVAAFLDGARKSLDLAIYDLRLSGAPAEALSRSVAWARRRGVRIRVMFNVDHPPSKPFPAPPAVDWDLVKSWKVEFRPISGVPDLMHHKYLVRDAGTASAALLTGSTNWTTDSWSREENVLLKLEAPELAEVYERNFDELWEKREVARSGHEPTVWLDLGAGLRSRAYFTPGRAEKLVHEIAQALDGARHRVRVCSPVITSGPILGTLAELAAEHRLDLAGVYDATQMAEVHSQWRQRPGSAWKIHAFDSLVAAAPFGAKVSTPWQSGSVHDFMHAKIVVADDTVFTGSYNLSHSGEENAENVVELVHKGLADMFTTFVDRVIARYRPKEPATAAG